jgi:hypothetical protein
VTNDGPENSRALDQPRYFDEQAKTLRPPPEKVVELNSELVKHEAKRVAETLQRIDEMLPLLATQEDLQPLNRGISAALSAAEAIESKVDLLRRDIELWLFGEKSPDGVVVRTGIVQHIDAAKELGKSALENSEKALRVAQETYTAVLHGPAAVEGKRGSLTPDAASSGAGRSPR